MKKIEKDFDAIQSTNFGTKRYERIFTESIQKSTWNQCRQQKLPVENKINLLKLCLAWDQAIFSTTIHYIFLEQSLYYLIEANPEVSEFWIPQGLENYNDLVACWEIIFDILRKKHHLLKGELKNSKTDLSSKITCPKCHKKYELTKFVFREKITYHCQRCPSVDFDFRKVLLRMAKNIL
jgi:hypothetical protein